MAPPRRPSASPAPASSRSSSGLGLGGGISVTGSVDGPRTELGEFAPNALTGWNSLARVLARRLPADLHHSSTLVSAARRRLARNR